MNTMAKVMIIVILVCSDQCFGDLCMRAVRKMLSSTGKPSGPQKALIMIGKPTAQLFTYRPAPSGVNPALLYDMTAKNNDSHSVRPTFPLFTESNPGNSAKNVTTSMTSVVMSTTCSTPRISDSLLVPSSFAASNRCMAFKWWLTARAMSEAKVMTPKPPICTEKISTTCPKIVQWSVVFTTEMPQVERAETAVKNAVENEVFLPGWVAIGRHSNEVETVMSARK